MKLFGALCALAGAAVLGWVLVRGSDTQPESHAQGPDVLLVTADTLRADRLGPYGSEAARTPTLDRLAEEGTLFEAALSPMQLTRPSHFSIFTSLYPRDHGVVNNKLALPDDLRTLTEVFRSAGYRTGAVTAVSLLGPESGVERAFDHFDHPVRPPADKSHVAGEVIARAQHWLGHSGGDGPVFLWLHLFDPHVPYSPPPSFSPPAVGEVARELPIASWQTLLDSAERHGGDLPEAAFARALDLYDAEITYLDHWLGVLLDDLRRRGRLDRTIVVFTADHGECFENGVYFEHAGCLFEGAARVPLIFRHPSEVPAGERRPEVVELLDVAPTLLALAGLPIPAEFQGRSLFDPADPARGVAFLQHPLFSEVGVRNRSRTQRKLGAVMGQPTRPIVSDEEQVGLRTDEWKYVLTGEREELYHLPTDPAETRNLADERRDVTAQLRPRLTDWTGAHPIRRLDDSRINEELLSTLRALGYVD